MPRSSDRTPDASPCRRNILDVPKTTSVDGATEQPLSGHGTPARPSTPILTSDDTVQNGLTLASLKHLRRQNAGLNEDKERLNAEIARLQALLLEQQRRVAELEASIPAATSSPEPSESTTRLIESHDREAAWSSKEAQLQKQMASLEEERSLLEHTLRRREQEIGRLKCNLDEQITCGKDQNDANERAKENEERVLRRAASLAEKAKQLESDLVILNSNNARLEEHKGELAEQLRISQDEVSQSAAKVEGLTKLYEDHKHATEQLRSGVVGTAIQSKLELHISVPHVVLTYNNAPPLTVSTAIGLSKARVLKFLEGFLFPHFEPLWVCLDGVDKAPDGTNKKKYSSRMLSRLTDSVKEFIEKSQLGEEAELVSSDTVKEVLPRSSPPSRSSIRSAFKGIGSLRTHP